ncbi:hypothetical protein BH23GEM10_BH23GEM10_00740 [soil metagenome]
MRSNTVALLMAATLATGPGCTRGAVGPQSDAALADTLKERIAAAYTFDRPGAVERMNALYPSTGRVVSASAGHMTTTVDSLRAAIASFWEQAGQNMTDARWEWGLVEVDRLGDDAAVLTGTWSIPHIAPGGQEHVIRGAWTAVFRRLAGEWRIVHEHLSVPVD